MDDARTWTQNSVPGFSVGRGSTFGVAVAGTGVGGTAVGGFGRGVAVDLATGVAADNWGSGAVGSSSISVITTGLGDDSIAGAELPEWTENAAPYPSTSEP